MRTLLLLTILILASAPFTNAQDVSDLTKGECLTKTDEFTGKTSSVCFIGDDIEIEDQPSEPIMYMSLYLSSEAFVITSISDSWNFLSVDKAYMLIDGERFTLSTIQLDREVDGGSVTEQTAVVVSGDVMRVMKSASTIRMKIGQAVLNIPSTPVNSAVSQL